MTETPPAPGAHYVFSLRAQLSPPQDMGHIGGILRRIIPIVSGKISGPRLEAEMLPGGADWQEIFDTGLARLHARYAIKASDGTVIGVNNYGIRRATPEVIARLTAGEAVDPSLIYFCSTPVFDAPPGPHRWLSESIFLCTGVRHPNEIELRFFEVE